MNYLCEYCNHFGPLTKKGLMYRHRFKTIHLRRTFHGFDIEAGYNTRETKKECQGSGRKPRKVK